MEVFALGSKDYIALGLDDGSLHLYDYTENESKPQTKGDKPIFVITKTNEEGASEIPPHPDDIFLENIYEHSDSISVIEKNYAD